MEKSTEIFKLPAGPAELCFDKNEFMKKTFTVDEFLHNHRNAATLETIRDDLGIYLKVLRSAMIELINEDYADFVNLSSDLVGLDQSIHKIQSPLLSLQDEISSIHSVVSDEMHEIDDCLAKKRQLHDQLKSVQSFLMAKKSIEKLEKLLCDDLNEESGNFSPVMLERGAMELVRLKHNLNVCRPLFDRVDFNENLKRFDEIQRQFLHKIEKHFLQSIESKNSEQLERCLHIFCTLGEQRKAEEIFQCEIVGAHMDSIISESSLQNSPQGLNGIYRQILQFVDDRMKLLLALTHINAYGKTTVVGFDFLINSFWTEVERRLETHMASIFAPGIPDQFFQRYQNTIAFLEKIEEFIRDHDQIQAFRQHKQYKQFQTKWNLRVYYQIRFQEIGSALETSCSRSINAESINDRLKPFLSLLTCLKKCWADGVFLPQIFLKFLKFTMQMYNRIAIWMDQVIKNDKNNVKHIEFLVALYLEASKAIKQSDVLSNEIIAKMPENLKNDRQTIEECLTTTRNSIELRLRTIEKQWNDEMLKQTIGWTKQVADIPRLYRKTNRDAPSKPCNYVEQILKPARNFVNLNASSIDASRIHECLVFVFSHLNKQYYSAVTDVLTSVRKTEESLRRLKNLREKSSTNSNQPSNAGMSDDDKIRLQLHVDISVWSTEIERFNVKRSEVEMLNELIEMVENCTKIKVENQS